MLSGYFLHSGLFGFGAAFLAPADVFTRLHARVGGKWRLVVDRPLIADLLDGQANMRSVPFAVFNIPNEHDGIQRNGN